MKVVYPVIFTQLDDGYMAYSPDFENNTQGDSLTDAIEMMRDAIGLMGIDMQDDKKEIPAPSDPASIRTNAGEVISLVGIDFAEYRQENRLRNHSL